MMEKIQIEFLELKGDTCDATTLRMNTSWRKSSYKGKGITMILKSSFWESTMESVAEVKTTCK